MPDAVNREAGSPVDGGAGPALPWGPRCLGCGGAGQARLDLCDVCATRLPWAAPTARIAPPPEIDRVVARSEERRVGKEGRDRGATEDEQEEMTGSLSVDA